MKTLLLTLILFSSSNSFALQILRQGQKEQEEKRDRIHHLCEHLRAQYSNVSQDEIPPDGFLEQEYLAYLKNRKAFTSCEYSQDKQAAALSDVVKLVRLKKALQDQPEVAKKIEAEFKAYQVKTLLLVVFIFGLVAALIVELNRRRW